MKVIISTAIRFLLTFYYLQILLQVDYKGSHWTMANMKEHERQCHNFVHFSEFSDLLIFIWQIFYKYELILYFLNSPNK